MTRGRMLYIYNEENLKTTSILSEKEFVDIINRLQEAADLQEQVDRLVRNSRVNIESDFCDAAALQISHESSVVFLLKLLYDFISNNGVMCQKEVCSYGS